jgi:copper(I)-binding protein
MHLLQFERRQLLRLGLASGLSSGLSLASSRAQACEFFASTLRVTHPWTRASVDGDSSAIVCMKFDEVQQDDRLIGVETDLASGAEMGGLGARAEVDFAIPRGQETVLSERGTFVRLVGLLQPLDVGRSYPIRLRFEKGGVLRADLSVDFARFR